MGILSILAASFLFSVTSAEKSFVPSIRVNVIFVKLTFPVFFSLYTTVLIDSFTTRDFKVTRNVNVSLSFPAPLTRFLKYKPFFFCSFSKTGLGIFLSLITLSPVGDPIAPSRVVAVLTKSLSLKRITSPSLSSSLAVI